MYILTTMDANLDLNGKTPLINLLTDLLNGISNALGGINTLEPFIDEVENLVKIVDQSTLPGKYEILSAIGKVKPSDTTILNLYGYYNRLREGTGAGFVRSFGIKTEISPNLATMLSIGAQAAGSVVGEDATALSKLNEGLEDRIKNDVVDAIVKSDKTKSKTEELAERFPNANKNFAEAAFQLGSLNGSVPTWDPENINSYTQLQSDFLTYLNAKQAITTKKPSSSTGFIPINLNLTLDGISGLKIYNALRVDTSYLPSNYPVAMDFIITGLSHTIQNNVWVTEIDTNMVPRDPSQSAGGKYEGRPTSNQGQQQPPRGSARGTSCTTAYPELPFTDPRPGSDLLSFSTAATYLNRNYGSSLGKAVFAVLFAEAAKSGNNFVSAGGHNYAGVQTDNAKWGAPGIIGQYCRVDSGGVARAFAIFESDEAFLDFMANRIKAKGFDGDSGEKWVTTYILKWWSPKDKNQYAVKGSEKYNSKLSIYNSAIKRYNNNIA